MKSNEFYRFYQVLSISFEFPGKGPPALETHFVEIKYNNYCWAATLCATPVTNVPSFCRPSLTTGTFSVCLYHLHWTKAIHGILRKVFDVITPFPAKSFTPAPTTEGPSNLGNLVHWGRYHGTDRLRPHHPVEHLQSRRAPLQWPMACKNCWTHFPAKTIPIPTVMNGVNGVARLFSPAKSFTPCNKGVINTMVVVALFDQIKSVCYTCPTLNRLFRNSLTAGGFFRNSLFFDTLF